MWNSSGEYRSDFGWPSDAHDTRPVPVHGHLERAHIVMHPFNMFEIFEMCAQCVKRKNPAIDVTERIYSDDCAHTLQCAHAHNQQGVHHHGVARHWFPVARGPIRRPSIEQDVVIGKSHHGIDIAANMPNYASQQKRFSIVRTTNNPWKITKTSETTTTPTANIVITWNRSSVLAFD